MMMIGGGLTSADPWATVSATTRHVMALWRPVANRRERPIHARLSQALDITNRRRSMMSPARHNSRFGRWVQGGGSATAGFMHGRSLITDAHHWNLATVRARAKHAAHQVLGFAAAGR